MINFKSGLIYCIMSSIMIPALVILIIFSSIYGNALDIISFTLFGTSLFLLFLFNTLYYWIKNETASKIFLKLKTVFSYVFIAATYTCICLGPLIGPWGWSIFGVVCGLSLLGIIFSSIWSNIPNIIILISRIIIVLILFIALKPLSLVFLGINFIGLILFIFAYTFYLFSGIFKLKNWHFLTSIFSILGTVCSYVFLIKYLLFI